MDAAKLLPRLYITWLLASTFSASQAGYAIPGTNPEQICAAFAPADLTAVCTTKYPDPEANADLSKCIQDAAIAVAKPASQAATAVETAPAKVAHGAQDVATQAITTISSWGRRLQSNGCDAKLTLVEKPITQISSFTGLGPVCNKIGVTASTCHCYGRLQKALVRASLNQLNGAGNDADPASAVLYEAVADIADCFTTLLPLQSNEANVRAQRSGVTWAPLFGYHQYYKFAATIAGCAGSIGTDCLPGFIDFFSDYFQLLANNVLKTLSNALLQQVAAYQNAANTLQGLAGNATAVLTAMSGAASTCSNYAITNNFASSSLHSTISSFNDVAAAVNKISNIASALKGVASDMENLSNGFLPFLTARVETMVNTHKYNLAALIPLAQLSKLGSIQTTINSLSTAGSSAADFARRASTLRAALSDSTTSTLTAALQQCGSDSARSAEQLLRGDLYTAASLLQGTSFHFPTHLSFSSGVDTVKTWVNVNVDLPCSTWSQYCVNVPSKECVGYPEFYRCTFDPPGGVALMPEFLPWAELVFS